MNTHTETKSKYFDGHGSLSQSEESECMWAHDKDGVTRVSVTKVKICQTFIFNYCQVDQWVQIWLENLGRWSMQWSANYCKTTTIGWLQEIAKAVGI